MRRHHRGSGGASLANKVAAPISDAMSLIRSFNSENNPSRPVRPSPLAASPVQDMPADLLDRIRSFPLFQSTPDSFLVEVALHLKPQSHSPNDYILTEGDDAKAMYWLVRGAVAVTSRDGESTYVELKPGAFFGEIGILMDRPRTATVIAQTKCFLVSLRKEDLQKLLPSFPEVEQAIRDEAQERLNILEKKKKESRQAAPPPPLLPARRGSKRMRDYTEGRDEGDSGDLSLPKKRKSPSPGVNDVNTSSALGNGLVNVRLLLKELPLFSNLPPEILHFLGLNAQPSSFPPFTDIIKQDSQGREVYFIVRGEVEVIDEKPEGQVSILVNGVRRGTPKTPHVKARLKQGQYFGEVVSLSLAPRRTATVRSVSAVECLVITGNVLAEFWDRCPPEVRQQIETTAKQRLESASDNDVIMNDSHDPTPAIDELAIGERRPLTPRKSPSPRVTFNKTKLESTHRPARLEEKPVLKPSDPDPYLNVGLDNIRSRSRRGSLAPIPPDETPSEHQKKNASPPETAATTPSPSKPKHTTTPPDYFPATKRSKIRRVSKKDTKGLFPDKLLLQIFNCLPLHELMRLRAVSSYWSELLTKSPELLRVLDLTLYNRKVTDEILAKVICPFVGNRPSVIDISNCFHITDEGFTSLANTCGTNVVSWKMRSVWDVTAPAILEMANKAKGLQEVDLSNCRKVSDMLLARIVGWVVPASSYAHQQINGRSNLNTKALTSQSTLQSAAGTVFGCPYLKRLTLSYCKHITDRSMHHIASHAAPRLEEVDLTRCTTITDQGFQYWGNAQFSRLRKLCLADCTYLTDNTIIYLTNSAKGLQDLDLSFCCALSDTATEVLALGCSQLTHLNLSFCGSAVSDPSLRSIGLHLLSLRVLSVRGCVRVTGTGVEAVMSGCHKLEVFDVSQCKNLTPWLQGGEAHRYGSKIRFETVARRGKLLR